MCLCLCLCLCVCVCVSWCIFERALSFTLFVCIGVSLSALSLALSLTPKAAMVICLLHHLHDASLLMSSINQPDVLLQS